MATPDKNISLSVNSLTGYTGELTPFTFIPQFSNATYSNDRLVWDFGDGTISTELTAVHTYNWPGEYGVSLVCYNSAGAAFISKERTMITVSNYITDKLELANYDFIDINILAGKQTDFLIQVNRFNSWQSYPSLSAIGYTLTLYASGSLSKKLNVESFLDNKWAHLDNVWYFYEQIEYDNGVTDRQPIDNIETTCEPLYYKNNGGTIERCLVTDTDAVFVGTSGSCEFFYNDPIPKNYTSEEDPVLLYVSNDMGKFPDIIESLKGQFTYVNTLDIFQHQKLIIPVKLRYNTPAGLKITSNGLFDMEIDGNKWQYNKIPFTVNLYDVNNHFITHYPPLSLNTTGSTVSSLYVVNLSVVKADDTAVSLSADFFLDDTTDLPSQINGTLRGYFIPYETYSNAFVVGRVNVQNEFYYNSDMNFGGWLLHDYDGDTSRYAGVYNTLLLKTLSLSSNTHITTYNITNRTSYLTEYNYGYTVAPSANAYNSTIGKLYLYNAGITTSNINTIITSYSVDVKNNVFTKLSCTDLAPLSTATTHYVILKDGVPSIDNKLFFSYNILPVTIGSEYRSIAYVGTDNSLNRIVPVYDNYSVAERDQITLDVDLSGNAWYTLSQSGVISAYKSNPVDINLPTILYTISDVSQSIITSVLDRDNNYYLLTQQTTPIEAVLVDGGTLLLTIQKYADFEDTNNGKHFYNIFHLLGITEADLYEIEIQLSDAKLLLYLDGFISTNGNNVYGDKGWIIEEVWYDSGVPIGLVVTPYYSEWLAHSETPTFDYSANVAYRVYYADGILYKLSETEVTPVFEIQQFINPQSISIDNDQNIWVTHYYNRISKIDKTTGVILSSFDVNYSGMVPVSARTDNVSAYGDLDNITFDISNNIWVINNTNTSLYIVNPVTSSIIKSSVMNVLVPTYCIGDWNGWNWYNKFWNASLTLNARIGIPLEINGSNDNEFAILPASGDKTIAKFNEHFDAQENTKSYRFQERLLEFNFFFDEFLGTITGNVSSSPTVPGKVLYERVANFFDNHGDVDTCIIDQIYSLAQQYLIEMDDYRYSYPPTLKRLMDIMSIQHKRLFGERSKFQRDFDKRNTTNSIYGKNLGEKINNNTYMVSAGQPFVAFQLFNSEYKLINPTCVAGLSSNLAYVSGYGLSSYPLSTFSSSWNWLLDQGIEGSDIFKYYDFYYFIPTYSNLHMEGVLDWSNTFNNTVVENVSSLSAWIGDNELVDKMLDYEIRKNLDLFTR